MNTAGMTLFGTLHVPAKPVTELPAVLLLSPGVKMRVGPGRLYVPLTDRLTDMGYTVLRFDFYGLGDSEGDLPETMLADVYNNIEVGRYVDDTQSAMQWLTTNHGFERFILGGLCGGAITALLTADKEASVDALLSIGMTVTLASNAATPAKYLTRKELDVRRSLYFRTLLRPKSWLRFLTFQSEYGVIWRSMLRLVFKNDSAAASGQSVGSDSTEEQRGNSNPLFAPAFLGFLRRGGRALMLFSEKDRLYAEYEEKFVLPFAQELQPFLPQLEQHVILDANHVLSSTEAKTAMVTIVGKWMRDIHSELK
jgi:pimeloyl-ACP methyl ester carboxylesterase